VRTIARLPLHIEPPRRVVFDVLSGLLIERIRERDAHTSFGDMKIQRKIRGFSSIPHALKSAVLCRCRLPAFESTHVELSVGRIEPRAHDSAGELQRQSARRALNLSADA